MKNPIRLYSSNQRFEIELLKAKLAEEQIECYLMDKQDSAYVVIGDVELYVDESDKAKAEYILTESGLFGE